MEVTINQTGESAPETPSAAPLVPAGAAEIVVTRGTMLIEGQNRETLSATVAGKSLVWTPTLNFMESWDVERFLDRRDMLGTGSTRVMAIATVRSIDGNPCPFPSGEVAIRGRINELGDRAARFIYQQYLTHLSGSEDVVKN
jgi:hypothetical protein